MQQFAGDGSGMRDGAGCRTGQEWAGARVLHPSLQGILRGAAWYVRLKETTKQENGLSDSRKDCSYQ